MKFAIQINNKHLTLMAMVEGFVIGTITDEGMKPVVDKYEVIEMSLDEAKEVCENWEGTAGIELTLINLDTNDQHDIHLFSKR